MLHRRISYAALLLAAVAFQIFFRYYLSTFTLVLVVLLPVLAVLLSLPGTLGTALTLFPGPAVPRGEQARFTLRLTQRAGFPLPPVKVILHWTNQLTGESGRTLCTLRPQGGETDFTLQLPTPHCGRLVCRVEGARCCDLLGLFPLPLPGKPQAALLSLPLPTEALLPEELDSPRTGGVVLKPRPGGRPGEDYALRDYRPGRPLRSVHWKLSSKKDELVVRETLEPRQAEVVLTYDHFGPPEALDQVFDRLCALSRLLLEKGRAHHIQWAAPASGVVEDRAVDSERALLTCLEMAFSLPAPETGHSILDGALQVPGGVGQPLHFHITPADGKGGRT